MASAAEGLLTAFTGAKRHRGRKMGLYASQCVYVCVLVGGGFGGGGLGG